jgi:ketosteroid isomerase-like protein
VNGRRVSIRTAVALLAALALPAAAGAAAVVPPPGATAAGAPGAAPAGTAGKQPPLPPATAARRPAPDDHRQENKALVRRYLTEVLAAGKLAKLDEIVAKAFTDRSPGAPSVHGAAVVRQTRQRIESLFDKVDYEPQEMVAEDDRVAVRYLVIATPRREPGRPAPQPVVLTGLALFRVLAGRLQDVFVLNDQVGMLRQLGYTMVPPGAATASPPAASRPPSPPAVSPSGVPPPAGSAAPSGTVSPPPASPAPPSGAASPPPPGAVAPSGTAPPPPSGATLSGPAPDRHNAGPEPHLV